MSQSDQNQDNQLNNESKETSSSNHWRSLAEMLGAEPAEEPDQETPGPETPSMAEESGGERDETSAESGLEPAEEASAPHRSTLPPRPTSNWSGLAAELGIEVEPPPPELDRETGAEGLEPEAAEAEATEVPSAAEKETPGAWQTENVSPPDSDVAPDLELSDDAGEETAVTLPEEEAGAPEEESDQGQPEFSRRRSRRKRRRRTAIEREEVETIEDDGTDPASFEQAQVIEVETEWTEADEEEAVGEEAEDLDEGSAEEHEKKRRRRRRRRRPRRRDDQLDADKDNAVEEKVNGTDAESSDADDETLSEAYDDDDNKPAKKGKHRKIPTWEEAVSVIVENNLEARARNTGSKGKSRGSRRRRN